jgi:hypothetical protein
MAARNATTFLHPLTNLVTLGYAKQFDHPRKEIAARLPPLTAIDEAT